MFRKVSFWVIICSILISIAVYFLVSDYNEYKVSIIVNTLSIGITAGLIDVFANILPKKQRKQTAKKIINKDINWLMFTMEGIITTTLLVFNIKKTWQNVVLNDLSGENRAPNQLNGNTQYMNDIIIDSFCIYDRKTKIRKTGFTNAPISFNDYIKSNIRKINEYIDKITSFEYFYESDADFVEVITRLKYCDFIKYYGYKDNRNPTIGEKLGRPNWSGPKDIPCFLFANSGVAFIEFIEIYRKLFSLKYNTEFSVCKTIIGDEALDYKKNFDKNRVNIV